MSHFSKEIEVARKAAQAGAQIVIRNFRKSKEAQVKNNSKGLVTQTDLEAERVILEILASNSEYEILSEESGSSGKSTGPVWVVDPLDGTNNFAHSLPFFAVSVGLMHKNESLVGVIIDPINQREYYATKGGGAFCNGQILKLSKFDSEYIPSIFLNHGYAEVDRSKFKQLSKLFATTHNILKLGTTALELCYIAEGAVDGFICSGDELWDFAAGIVIAKEAGIIFTDWQGNHWDGKTDNLLFARPEIHKNLVDSIGDLQ